MWALTLPRETWQAFIDSLRAKGLPYMLHHADVLEQRVAMSQKPLISYVLLC